VQKIAPGVDIAVVPIDERRFGERLETGEVDVAVVPRFDTPKSDRSEPSAAGLLRRTLTGDRFVCLLRKGHPLLRARQKLTLKNYVALSHVLVSPRGEGPGPVDRELEQHGLVRRVALRVPNFYSALAIVRRSDLILTVPSALARLQPDDPPVRALAPPLRLPRHSVNLVWHERFSNDHGQRWLRDLVTEVVRATHREDGGDQK
jgi:DNA-binding transcriptional LysR family regulator